MDETCRRSLVEEALEYCDDAYKACLVFLLVEEAEALELLNANTGDELIRPLQDWADRQNEVEDDEFECKIQEAFEMCKMCFDVRKNGCQKYFEDPKRLCSFLEESRFIHPMKKLLLYSCRADREADSFVSKVHKKFCSEDEISGSPIPEVVILDLILRKRFLLGSWNAAKERVEPCTLAFVDENFENNEFSNIFDRMHSLQHVINTKLSRYPIYFEQDVGIFLIINNENFIELKSREGTEYDENKLKECWEMFGFCVKIHNDLSAGDIITCVKHYVGQMKKKHSVFMFCILSHGTGDSIAGSDDRMVKISDIKHVLLTCEQLHAKPKILILQACRGNKTVIPAMESDSSEALSRKEVELEETIKKGEDLLILYSTLEEYVALRDKYSGTLYIRKLCQVFESVARLDQIDFQRTLLKVHHHVSRVEDCIQVCSFEGHLTKKLILKKIENFD